MHLVLEFFLLNDRCHTRFSGLPRPFLACIFLFLSRWFPESFASEAIWPTDFQQAEKGPPLHLFYRAMFGRSP